MKRTIQWVLAATLTSGLSVSVNSCTNNIDNSVVPQEHGQFARSV